MNGTSRGSGQEWVMDWGVWDRNTIMGEPEGNWNKREGGAGKGRYESGNFLNSMLPKIGQSHVPTIDCRLPRQNRGTTHCAPPM